jgi:hypothetical protein
VSKVPVRGHLYLEYIVITQAAVLPAGIAYGLNKELARRTLGYQPRKSHSIGIEKAGQGLRDRKWSALSGAKSPV